jgi:hypothetical protein
MRRFKDILSLILEAKFEPGGPDVGKLFGERGKYAPKKGPKEKTAQQRMKSGELTPNVDRPTGLETNLERHPPEGAQFVEPTAKQRASGKRVIDRMITPEHPGIADATGRSKETPKTKKEKTGSVVRFTNNVHHDIIGTNNKEILDMLKESYPEFIPHSDKLTAEYAAVLGDNNGEFSKRTAVHLVVNKHLRGVINTIKKSSNNLVLPNSKKFGKTKINTIETVHDLPGTKTLKIIFNPMKTYLTTTSEIRPLLDHLSQHTGHEWYLHPDSSDYMVGAKSSPLVLGTDINHPDLGDPGRDGDGDKRNPKKPPRPGGRAPTRPRTPALV